MSLERMAERLLDGAGVGSAPVQLERVATTWV